MKVKVITFIMLTSSVAFSYAQNCTRCHTRCNTSFFVEGSILFTGFEGRVIDTDFRREGYGFEVSTKAGYWLNDRIAVGIDVTYATQNPIGEVKFTSNYFGLGAFSRYQLFRWDRLAILAEGSAGVRLGTGNEDSVSELNTEYSLTDFVFIVRPLITYDISNRFSVVVVCDFMRLVFQHRINRTYSEGFHTETITTQFYFGASSTVFDSLSDIRIGFSFNF